MKRRARIHYTREQKTLMWDRWQAGDSLHDIARLFDRHHSSVRGILERSGGIRPDADLQASYVIRGKKLLPVSLYELLQRGDVRHDVLLQDRDFIYIPPASDQGRVYVLGEVDDPGPVPINPGGILSLAEAIAAAGDIDPVMANKNHVKIFRGEWGQPQEFLLSYNDVKRFGGSIPLKRNDRIYVGPRALATWGRAWALLLPFVNNPIILAQLTSR